MSDLGRVELIGLPVPVHVRASEHSETLRRELAFLHHSTSTDSAPGRLRAISDDHAQRYGGLTVAPGERLAEAIDAGAAAVDLVFELPLDVVDACLELGQVLDELDQFCTDGDLLTLVTPPEAVEYRRWFLGEFVRQLRDGLPPSPWVAQEEADGRTPAPQDGLPVVTVVVEGDLDLGQTSALRDRLVTATGPGAVRVVVDVSRCEFMDSAGLSLLVTTQQRLRSAGGDLIVVGAGTQVLSLLRISGVLDLLVNPEGQGAPG